MEGGLEPSDERLVSLSKDGNLEAFNSLVERHQAAIYALCFRLLGDRASAEDATQEAFLSAFRAITRFSEGNFRGWLMRIAANQCKDDLRRRSRRPSGGSLDAMLEAESGAFEPQDPSPGAPEQLEASEFSAAVQALLGQLPFDQREAVVLSDLHGYHYDEIARISGASIGTVKSRIHRGREKLRHLVAANPELFGTGTR